MKKLFFTLTLTGALLGSTLVTRAEDAAPAAPAAPRAGGPGGRFGTPEERLKRMTETLSLTQDQQDKIKAIFEKDKSKFDDLKNVPQDQRRAKVGELRKAEQEEIAAVLTQEQKDKQKADMEKRRAERAAGGGGAAKPGEAK